eukprot:15446258-Alexandrium_andersonii.AAC.1
MKDARPFDVCSFRDPTTMASKVHLSSKNTHLGVAGLFNEGRFKTKDARPFDACGFRDPTTPAVVPP